MYSEEKKQQVLETFRNTLGNIRATCKKHGIDRGTFYNWVESDPAFAAKVEEYKLEAGDYVEQALAERIDAGDTTAIIFALKTKYKDRGWTEKQEVAVDVTSGGQPVRYADIMPKE